VGAYVIAVEVGAYVIAMEATHFATKIQIEERCRSVLTYCLLYTSIFIIRCGRRPLEISDSYVG
jgi:hypothetical protein